jgi:hypothetical protein
VTFAKFFADLGTCDGEQIKCCELADDAQHCSERFCQFEITRTALIGKPDRLELSISGMAVQESRVRSKL